MAFFTDMNNDQPWLKIGIEGFSGGGKTYTATEIAKGLHRELGLKTPIAYFLTEPGAKRLAKKLKAEGFQTVAKESKTLADLMQAIKYAESEGLILIIDSMTHIWQRFMDDYLAQRNAVRASKGWRISPRLEFQDWGIIKPKWTAEFTVPFVEAKAHIIFTGRASYEYDYESMQEGAKKELVKTGIKMSTEKNTAYETDINILMEMETSVLGDKKEVWRNAFIKKDRTGIIDGKEFRDPSFEDFRPAIMDLLDGTKERQEVKETPNEFEVETPPSSDRAFTVSMEEVKGQFDRIAPGTSTDAKKLKAEISQIVFGTTSATKIGQLGKKEARKGIESLKSIAEWAYERSAELQAEGGELKPLDVIEYAKGLIGSNE